MHQILTENLASVIWESHDGPLRGVDPDIGVNMVSLIDIFGKKQPLLRAAVCQGLSALEKGIYRILDRKRRAKERGGERRRAKESEGERGKRGRDEERGTAV